MKNLNDCSKEELQQEYAEIACHNLAVLSVIGSKKQLKQAEKYKNAIWSKLNEIEPMKTNFNDDELLAELFS